MILIFTISASGNLTPTFAKSLTKSVKEKYVKILRENLTRAAEEPYKPYFMIADIDNDGNKDLLIGGFGRYYDDRSSDIGAAYLNKKDKVVKGKFYTNNDEGEQTIIDDVMSKTEYECYKNYLLIPASHLFTSYYVDFWNIFKADKKDNFRLAYRRSIGHKIDTDEVTYDISEKVIDGKLKEITAEEYEKFAGKFKKIKSKWKKVTEENIKMEIETVLKKTIRTIRSKEHFNRKR